MLIATGLAIVTAPFYLQSDTLSNLEQMIYTITSDAPSYTPPNLERIVTIKITSSSDPPGTPPTIVEYIDTPTPVSYPKDPFDNPIAPANENGRLPLTFEIDYMEGFAPRSEDLGYIKKYFESIGFDVKVILDEQITHLEYTDWYAALKLLKSHSTYDEMPNRIHVLYADKELTPDFPGVYEYGNKGFVVMYKGHIDAERFSHPEMEKVFLMHGIGHAFGLKHGTKASFDDSSSMIFYVYPNAPREMVEINEYPRYEEKEIAQLDKKAIRTSLYNPVVKHVDIDMKEK